MLSYKDKTKKAREILDTITNGVNPITKEAIESDNFINDPRLSRCFIYVCEILDKVINDNENKKLTRFNITKKEKVLVRFPDYNIGISHFTKCINDVINLNISRNLSPYEFNKKLRESGLLAETIGESGKARSVLNGKSAQYGFEMEHRNVNGKEYDMIVINDYGKKYLLENLEKIMEA